MVAENVEETEVEGAETTSGETLIEETETVETATEDFLKEMIQIQILKDRSQNRIISAKLGVKGLAMHITMLPNLSYLENLGEIEMIK